jgi:hypothetical protein
LLIGDCGFFRLRIAIAECGLCTAYSIGNRQWQSEIANLNRKSAITKIGNHQSAIANLQLTVRSTSTSASRHQSMFSLTRARAAAAAAPA